MKKDGRFMRIVLSSIFSALVLYRILLFCFLACKLTKKQGAYVDSQIWHLPRPTGLTGRVDRLDRSGLYSPSRIRVFVKSPYVILLVKGYVFPVL